MMRSLYSGISGLRVHQTKMDVIGNNIANVNTTGFKASTVQFREVFNETLQSATGANETTGKGGSNPMQIGLGVDVASIGMKMTEGPTQRTDNPLDFRINGEGFFIVKGTDGQYFTRAGAFKVDNQGNLVTPEGLNIMGWLADEKGMVIQGDVKPINISAVQNSYGDAKATDSLSLTGTIDIKSMEQDKSIYSNIDIYDSLGYSTNLTVEMKYKGEVDSTNSNSNSIEKKRIFQVSIKANDKDGMPQNIEVGNVAFGSDGNYEGITGGPPSYTIEKTKKQFDLTNKQLTSIDNDGLGIKPIGVFADNIKIDLSTLNIRATANGTTFDTVKGIQGQGGGKKTGEVEGYNVGKDGKITLRYDNGDQKVVGQIVLAQFDNPAGFEKVGANLYKETTNSGEFDGIGKDPSIMGAEIQSGVLEMSNIDLATEFTEMITTQRGYQANSRIITTADEMMEEIVNLKR